MMMIAMIASKKVFPGYWPHTPWPLPGWAVPLGPAVSEADATFAAGIALKSLDDLMRSSPAFAGCWRARQTLDCATAAVQIGIVALPLTLVIIAGGIDVSFASVIGFTAIVFGIANHLECRYRFPCFWP